MFLVAAVLAEARGRRWRQWWPICAYISMLRVGHQLNSNRCLTFRPVSFNLVYVWLRRESWESRESGAVTPPKQAPLRRPCFRPACLSRLAQLSRSCFFLRYLNGLAAWLTHPHASHLTSPHLHQPLLFLSPPPRLTSHQNACAAEKRGAHRICRGGQQETETVPTQREGHAFLLTSVTRLQPMLDVPLRSD